MALADTIQAALTAGAQAGATATSTAGQNFVQDINNFVVPHLRDIAIQVAGIVEKRLAGVFTDAAAKALIDSERDAIQTLVDTVVSLTVFAAQQIVNAIVDALNKAVNTAVGFTLLV